MIGDTLSDTHAKLVDDASYYCEEVASLPREMRGKLYALIASVDALREEVDHYQVTAPLRAAK